MKTRMGFSFVLLILLLHNSFATNNEFDELDCLDFKTLLVGNIFAILAKKEVRSENQTKLLLATKGNPVPVDIKNYSWNDLLNIGFDTSKKTYVIIHGFQNDAYAEWIVKLKEELLKTVNINILIVNWNSYSWNYLDAVHATLNVRNEVFNALEKLKVSYKLVKKKKRKVLWNHLYFIGHSLGAHLSGQISHILKKDNFYKVERITGLDPARPCFSNCQASLRLDKSHAEFVDVIHTQTGSNLLPDGFGARDPLGHVDFYVNGGAMQPKCEGSHISELNKMICSHAIVTDYFRESIINSRTNACRFLAYNWDRTFDSALKILKKRRENESCSNCPDMGFSASKNKGTGIFLVFTGMTAPHCRFTDSQSDNLLLGKSLGRLNIKTTTDPYEKYYLPDGNNV